MCIVHRYNDGKYSNDKSIINNISFNNIFLGYWCNVGQTEPVLSSKQLL